MVNRYDNPAEAEFMNTYVPIPFEQLYTLGKAANDRVDKAIADYNTAKNKWSEFQSRSAIDMANWEKETVGRVRPLMEQMSKNPELIKDAAFQMQLNSTINSVDTYKLNRLKTQAKLYDEYVKNVQDLIKNGLYNPEWHDFDFTNYDGLEQDLFNQTPLAYASVKDLTDKYVNNLDPSYLGRSDGFIHTGVTEDQIRKILNDNRANILYTPQAKRHIADIKRREGVDDAEAERIFINQAVQDNLEHTSHNVAVDPLYSQALNNKGSRSSSSEDSEPVVDIYDQMYLTSDMETSRKLQNDPILSRTLIPKQVLENAEREIIQHYLPALQAGEISKEEYEAIITDYQEQIKGLPDVQENRQNVYRDKFYALTGLDPLNGISKDWSAAQKTDGLHRYFNGYTRLLEAISVPSEPAIEMGYNTKRYGNSRIININDTPVSGFVVPTKDIVFDATLASKQMNVARKGTELMIEDENGRSINFEDAVQSGKYGNAIMIPRNSMFNVENQGVPSLGFRNDYYLSLDAIARHSTWDKDQLEDYFKNVLGEGCIVDNVNPDKISEDSTAKQTSFYQGKYLRITGSELIPNSGIRRMALNKAGDDVFDVTSGYSKQYPEYIEQSYAGYLNNLRNR